MEMTVLIHVFEFSVEAREPFELYMRAIGIPMKVVKAESVTEMKQCLTGRDAKVIVAKAIEHIPALLEFVNAGADEIEEGRRHAHDVDAAAAGRLTRDAGLPRRRCASAAAG